MPHSTYEGAVIFGFPRSGTTLLRRLIDYHPSFCCPPETHLLRACSRFLHEDRSAGGLAVSAIAGLSFSDVPEGVVLERLREFAFDFLRQIRDQSGKKYWVEKTAFDIFHIDAIERICANRCRFICMTRHPLDVVCSMRELTDKLEVYLPEIHEYVKHIPAPLEAYAQAWSDTNTKLVQLIEAGPDLCIQLKYEDLIKNADVVLNRLFTFLGEPTDTEGYADKVLDSAGNVGYGDWKTYEKKGIKDSSVERWKELSDHTVSRLAWIVNPAMEAAGYEPITHVPLLTDEEARRQFQFGRIIAQMKAT